LTLLQTTSKLFPGIPLSARWKRPACMRTDFGRLRSAKVWRDLR
jgi:hypothetical protein